MQVLTSISGIPLSAASAGFAPTNSADVSAIASGYQVVSSIGVAAGALSSINGYGLSAGTANSAGTATVWLGASGKLDNSAANEFYTTGNESGFVDSAYVESAVSGKQDELTFAYDADNAISSINGSALAGSGGGAVFPAEITSGSVFAVLTTGFQADNSRRASLILSSNPSKVTYPRVLIQDNRSLKAATFLADAFEFYTGADVKVFRMDVGGISGSGYFDINSAYVSGSNGWRYGTSENNQLTSVHSSVSSASSTWDSVTGKLDSSASSSFYTTANESGFVDSTYVESAVSGKQDALTFAYDADNAISSINGSALAGGGGGGGATGDYVEKSATSVPIGTSNTAGEYSLAVGSGNYNNRSASMLLGTNNSADLRSLSVGEQNSADIDSITVGYKNKSYVGISVGEENSARDRSIAVGNYASAEVMSISVGTYSYAEGEPYSLGGSIAVGYNVSAQSGSYAVGCSSVAKNNSFAHGVRLSAEYTAAAFGTYNQSGNGSGASGAAFVIGDGTADNSRHDLMVVTKDGEITIYSGTADTVGTGIMSSIRSISAAATGGGVNSATVSAIASSYAESAVSSKADESALSGYYTTANESGFITGVDLTDYATTAYVDSAVSGKMDASAIDYTRTGGGTQIYASGTGSSTNQFSAKNDSAGAAIIAGENARLRLWDTAATANIYASSIGGWNAASNLVSSQSANWGGSALQLSAGEGISLTMSGNILIIATASA